MTSTRKFFEQVITVRVLSEDVPLEWDDLDNVWYAISEGDCVGQVSETGPRELTPKEAADALTAAGSEPDFFKLNAEGEDIEE